MSDRLGCMAFTECSNILNATTFRIRNSGNNPYSRTLTKLRLTTRGSEISLKQRMTGTGTWHRGQSKLQAVCLTWRSCRRSSSVPLTSNFASPSIAYNDLLPRYQSAYIPPPPLDRNGHAACAFWCSDGRCCSAGYAAWSSGFVSSVRLRRSSASSAATSTRLYIYRDRACLDDVVCHRQNSARAVFQLFSLSSMSRSHRICPWPHTVSKRSKVKEIIVLIKARSFLDELNLEHLTSWTV